MYIILIEIFVCKCTQQNFILHHANEAWNVKPQINSYESGLEVGLYILYTIKEIPRDEDASNAGSRQLLIAAPKKRNMDQTD